jgi:hypothetical protein
MKLKPCPFCGNPDIHITYCGTGTWEIYSLDKDECCPMCDGFLFNQASVETPYDVWNRRINSNVLTS